MRIFLTGATGFIGSHVLAAALRSGYEVRALRREENRKPVITIPQEPDWHVGSLQSIGASELEGMDAIIHLACVGVSPKRASWSDLIENNLVGSINLFQAAARAGVSRVIVAGTCHEYGLAANRFFTIPPDAPLMPTSGYGASKAAMFQALHGFARDHGIELFYGRIFTAYGNGQHADNFWPSLRRAAKAGKDFAMTSGRQISDFIPVSEVSKHLVQACKRQDINPGVPLVTNIGTGIGCSLLEFAQREWEQMKASGKLIPYALPDRPDQIYRYIADLRGLVIPSLSH